MLQAAWLRAREQLQMCDRERDGAESGRMMDSGLRISERDGDGSHVKVPKAASTVEVAACVGEGWESV